MNTATASTFEIGETVFAYIFHQGSATERKVKLMPDRYVEYLCKDGETETIPIEDMGDYILSEKQLTEDQAYSEFFRRLTDSEHQPA